MFIAGFPAGPWGTNCYVAATAPGAECVVVDPGKDAAAGVAEVVREHRLKPVAVLVSHGHIDHMWCVAPVAGTYDATAYIHPDDRHLLTDPMAGLSRETAAKETHHPEPDPLLQLRRVTQRGRYWVGRLPLDFWWYVCEDTPAGVVVHDRCALGSSAVSRMMGLSREDGCKNA